MHEKQAIISSASAGRFCFPPVAFVSRRPAAIGPGGALTDGGSGKPQRRCSIAFLAILNFQRNGQPSFLALY